MRVEGVVPVSGQIQEGASTNQVKVKVEHTNKSFFEKQQDRIDKQLQHIEGKDKADALTEISEKLNRIMDAFDIQARFFVHKETKDIVVKLVDIKTNKVIREIPPEKILDMVAKMIKFIGMLFDEKV